jgi:hypothetical protein
MDLMKLLNIKGQGARQRDLRVNRGVSPVLLSFAELSKTILDAVCMLQSGG